MTVVVGVFWGGLGYDEERVWVLCFVFCWFNRERAPRSSCCFFPTQACARDDPEMGVRIRKFGFCEGPPLFFLILPSGRFVKSVSTHNTKASTSWVAGALEENLGRRTTEPCLLFSAEKSERFLGHSVDREMKRGYIYVGDKLITTTKNQAKQKGKKAQEASKR